MVAPLYADGDVELYQGDAVDVLRDLETDSVDAVVTSPPYLDARPEYGSPSWEELERIFGQCRRVSSGPMLVNVGRLWRQGVEVPLAHNVVTAAGVAGWKHVDTLVWAKLNANPIQGAVVANAHEYVLLFGEPAMFDTDAVRTEYAPGSVERLHRRWVSNIAVKGDTRDEMPSRQSRKSSRGKRIKENPAGARATSVFVCPTGRHKGNPHPAPMAFDLADYLVVLSGGTTILDPFAGSGTTALAARRRRRRSVLVELDPDYCALTLRRLSVPFDPVEPDSRPVQGRLEL